MGAPHRFGGDGVITVGVDAHKRIHVATALGAAGEVVGHWRGRNSFDGWQGMLEWATDLSGEHEWGIEGAWNYGRGLAQHLVERGECVYEVNARWTAEGRRRARRPGKTDRLDAQAVARFVRQEAPNLPRVGADDRTAVLDLLCSQRETLLTETTRLRNQLHALLTQLDPEYQDHLPAMDSVRGLEALERYEAAGTSVLQQERAKAVRRLAERLRLASGHASQLKRQIEAHTNEGGLAPLVGIHGVGLLMAGTLAGILGPGCRFRSDAELAAYAGVAPLEASSAGSVRHRLNRGGNRRLNSLLHMIALTQLSSWPPARAYVRRRIADGKSKREAMRALKRYLARAVWRAWKECTPADLAKSRPV